MQILGQPGPDSELQAMLKCLPPKNQSSNSAKKPRYPHSAITQTVTHCCQEKTRQLIERPISNKEDKEILENKFPNFEYTGEWASSSFQFPRENPSHKARAQALQIPPWLFSPARITHNRRCSVWPFRRPPVTRVITALYTGRGWA